jgi:hypothetical protein
MRCRSNCCELCSASSVALTLLVICKSDKTKAFWNMTPCRLVLDVTPCTMVHAYQLFFGASCIHLVFITA